MDLGSIIIGAIFIAICFLPIILMRQKRKKRESKTFQSLIRTASQYNCNINKHETCGDFVIGVDESKKSVFFCKQSDNKILEQYINLNEIKACKIKKSFNTFSNKKENNNVIDKIELIFIPFDKSKKENILEFYNTDNNVQLSGELQSAEKWNKLIGEYLKYK